MKSEQSITFYYGFHKNPEVDKVSPDGFHYESFNRVLNGVLHTEARVKTEVSPDLPSISPMLRLAFHTW